MVETPEGIGGRKWSYQKATDGSFELYEGPSKKLATLTPSGKEVFELLVTAPQLWNAANDCLLDASEANLLRLKNMVAKSVGKDNWDKVKQAE